MSNTLVKIKRSAVKGKSPSVSNVELGELALNTNDGRLFFKTTDSSGTSGITTLRQISGGTGITEASGVLNLDNTSVTAGTYGSTTVIPQIAVDAQGRITGVTNQTVAGVSSISFDSANGILSLGTADGSTFNAQLAIDAFDTDNLDEGSSNLYHTTARARGAISATGSLSYNSSTGVVSFTERTDAEVRGLISASGDINYNNSTGVISFSQTAAPVSSVNGETGAVTLTTNDVAEGGGVLYYTTARFDSDFGDNSTSDLSEGTNLYHTTARARNAISASNSGTGFGSISYTSGTGALEYTKVTNANIRSAISASTGISISNGAISTTITQYTDAMADSAARTGISVTDAGGDGSLSYNNSTGVITYTGPSASEVRAHLSAGTGVSYSSGEFSIGQAVGTTSDVTFNDVTVSGDLTVSGDNTTLNVGTLSVEDKNIVVGNNATTSALTDGAGLTFGAWSSGTIPVLKWDHGNTRFDFNKPLKASSFVGNIAGNVTGTVSDISNHDTDALSEGSSNLYHTTARARGAISASSGIDYNSSTGAITADQGEVRGFFSATGDLGYNASTGAFSFSETYSTAAELLTAIKTVDTNTSGLNADTLDGQQGTHYRINVYNSSGTLLN
jgi:hypothetical protein